MAPRTDGDPELLAKLERLVEEAILEKHLFTPEEVKLLQRVIARERGWEAIGSLAGTARAVLTWFGFMVGAWMAFKTGLLDWITTAIGGAK